LQEVTSADLFQITLAPDLPFAIGDERQIELALHHLMHNAVLMGHPAHPVEISAQTCKDSSVVTVASTPQGNEHNHHTYAHAAYEQTSCKADLLSQHITPEIRLYIASKLIQAQGGRVWTENGTETSTCYHFSLPRIEGQHVAQALAD
jgi:light-regulated signal transduction histidine kinase (bacteriophytochrome)